jgi:hypothetical protein
MNVPKRQGHALPIAESELQSLDALEIVEARTHGMGSAAGHLDASSSSIAPVGLELMAHRLGNEPAAVLIPAAPRRGHRRRVGLIIGTVAGCALVLLAAGIARVGHASSTPSLAPAPETEVAPPLPAPQTANVTPAPGSDGTSASTTPDRSSTGTVRLARGLSPHRVLFDGKKLSSATGLVSCGTHQIRVNGGRAHSVDVPCGGEIEVSK